MLRKLRILQSTFCNQSTEFITFCIWWATPGSYANLLWVSDHNRTQALVAVPGLWSLVSGSGLLSQDSVFSWGSILGQEALVIRTSTQTNSEEKTFSLFSAPSIFRANFYNKFPSVMDQIIKLLVGLMLKAGWHDGGRDQIFADCNTTNFNYFIDILSICTSISISSVSIPSP